MIPGGCPAQTGPTSPAGPSTTGPIFTTTARPIGGGRR